jgi:hypothetical protein
MANRAVLVGINRYKLPGSDLQGCVNDVTNVRDILMKYFGFTVRDIRVIVDERATKKAIMARLAWLVKGARSEDRLLFHYSGHGSQVRDRDGDELKDRMDEILCPHDMDWDGMYITDDELREVLGPVPEGVNLEVLLDSCHSGTGTRAAIGIAALPETLSFKPRYLVPPIDVQCRAEDDLDTRRVLATANPLDHVLFAGCRSNQTSADAFIGGNYNGAFTYYLCKTLRDTGAAVNRSELLKRIRASLRFNGFDQVPQLECVAGEKKKKVLE